MERKLDTDISMDDDVDMEIFECPLTQEDKDILAFIYDRININVINDYCIKIWNLLNFYQNYYDAEDDIFQELLGGNKVYFGCGYVLTKEDSGPENISNFKNYCKKIFTENNDKSFVREKIYLFYKLHCNLCTDRYRVGNKYIHCLDIHMWLLELKYHKDTLTSEDHPFNLESINMVFYECGINEQILDTTIGIYCAEFGTDNFGDILLIANQYLTSDKAKYFLNSPACRTQFAGFFYSFAFRERQTDRRQRRFQSNISSEKHYKCSLNINNVVPPLSMDELNLIRPDESGLYIFDTGRNNLCVVDNSNIYNAVAKKYGKELTCGISGSTTVVLFGMNIFSKTFNENEYLTLLLSLILLMYPQDHSLHEILSSAQSYINLYKLDSKFKYDIHLTDFDNITNIIDVLYNRKPQECTSNINLDSKNNIKKLSRYNPN